MKVLLDLNIWIDIAARKNTFPKSRELIKKLQRNSHSVCFPLSSYTTFYYLLKKLLGNQPAVTFCSLLRENSVQLLPLTEKEIILAHSLNFSDHEDACIAATALNSRCNFIVTRDLKGFKNSPIECINPQALLKRL